DRHVGLVPGAGGRPELGRPLAVHLADDRRAVGALAVLRLAARARRSPSGAARAPGDAAEQPTRRRPGDVLLSVHGPGGHLLRRPALPLGVSGPFGAGERLTGLAASARDV